MSKKKSPKKWIKFRHKVITALAYVVLYPIAKFKYNIKIEKFSGDRKRAYLILLNHQTPFDQFFVGMTFKKAIYYLATEDLFSMGFVSDLIRWIVAPIPIRKQTTDIPAVMNCIRVAKEGGSICIAPEGNRTYSGQTEYMNPSIAALAKKLNLPIQIHSRDDAEDTIEVLKSEELPEKVMFHCFDLNPETAKYIIKNGWSISVGGNITYKRKNVALEVLKSIPIDKIMTETDAPYLSPEGHRGERNSSKNIPQIIEKIAQIKGIEVEELAKRLYENAKAFYNI